MKYLVENKHWDINKDYNKEKLLYLLIDRSTTVNFSGDLVWFNDKNQVHRDYDLPAAVWNLEIRWYKNDQLHRDNNKSVYILFFGYKEYWSNGKNIINDKI